MARRTTATTLWRQTDVVGPIGGPVAALVDGSDPEMSAFRWAIDEAGRRGLGVRVVSTARDLLDAAMTDPAMTEVRERADVDVVTVQEWGDPSTVLLRNTRDAAMIVLGGGTWTEGAGTESGPTTIQVAMRASCPVVVLGPAPVGTSSAPSAGRILVGTDGSAFADHAAGFAFQEADLRGVGVTAVRAWLPSDADPRHPRWRGRLTSDLARWRERYPDVPVVEKSIAGAPWQVLLAESVGAEMLAVGSHGFGRPGLVLGSVSHTVLNNACCPVAIVR